MHITHLITTFFYVGHLRPAPGTWGSLAALPVAWGLHVAGGPWVLLGATFAVVLLGIWATAVETRGQADKDPSEIVIDEVAGQWIAFLPVSIGASHANADLLSLWPGFVFSFLAFRLFDIWKPGPIGWVDRRGDALGVMLDDVLAGLLAALCVMLAAGFYHGVLGL